MVIEADIENIRSGKEERKKVLQELLDEQRQKANHVLAVKSHMGITHSFVTSVSLEWIAKHVRFAKQLPNLEPKLGDDGKIKIDAETLDLVLQREPDWRRQYPLTLYLAERAGHKFPPILVTAWKPWALDSTSSEWVEGRATENSITEFPLDKDGAYLDLDCTDTQFYALDGQHRLMAIQGLKELLTKGRLFALRKDESERKNKFVTLDDLVAGDADQEATRAKLQGIMDESMGIEIIPAVQKDETEHEARMRLRSIFVHVNKHAKKTTRGEQALLDEDDGFAVVARAVMVKHRLFRGGRVDAKQGQLRETSEFLTTLETLVGISKLWLQSNFVHWSELKSDVPIRPAEEEIEEATEALAGYFDLLCELPSHQEILHDQGPSCSMFRTEGEKENIFFRPIAQLALADALAILRSEKHVNMQDVIKTMAEKEQQGAFRLRKRESIWHGVLCEVHGKNNMRRRKEYQTLCTKLLVYLLGGSTSDDDREELEADYINAREIHDNLYFNTNGTEVTRAEDVKFPAPWR